MRLHAGDRAEPATDTDTDTESHELPGARIVIALLVAAWVVVLVLYLRHTIVLSSDSVNNHVHVWYIAHDLWHHARIPFDMPVLAHGDAYAYPYGFVNWTTAAFVWPLFGDWAVTLWTALGVVGCIVATFVAFPELRRGWWAAAVLANPATLEALLFGQQSFAWGSMLLLFGIAAWRRGHPAWAAVLVGIAQANHAAIVFPMAALLVLGYLPFAPDRPKLLRWYALSCVIALPAVWLVLTSPTTDQNSAATELVNFWGTFGPRTYLIGLPILCVLLQQTGIRALAPIAFALALIGHASFEVPLNISQQWSALVHTGADTTALDRYVKSSSFERGATYRVLRGGDGKLGMYRVLRAGGTLDSELFPESMGIRSFRDRDDYATFICERRIDRIIHFDTYDEARHTNEVGMIESLEANPALGVTLRRVASGSGWQADAVDRTGCPSKESSAD